MNSPASAPSHVNLSIQNGVVAAPDFTTQSLRHIFGEALNGDPYTFALKVKGVTSRLPCAALSTLCKNPEWGGLQCRIVKLHGAFPSWTDAHVVPGDSLEMIFCVEGNLTTYLNYSRIGPHVFALSRSSGCVAIGGLQHYRVEGAGTLVIISRETPSSDQDWGKTLPIQGTGFTWEEVRRPAQPENALAKA